MAFTEKPVRLVQVESFLQTLCEDTEIAELELKVIHMLHRRL